MFNSAMKKHFTLTIRTVFQSYGVLAFSPHLVPAAFVLLATFYYPIIGLMGLVGNLISNLVAKWMHANDEAWKAGIFGVSGILVGLALGKYADPSLRMWIFLIVGAGISGVASIMLANFLAKYDLPILSLPFMMVIWLLLLSLGITEESVFKHTAIPFLNKVDIALFEWLPYQLFEFIKMFGSILFQDNLLSGVLVIIAIALYSRLSLIYGLWGGFLGMLTYVFLHGSIDGFHGLNFVLISLGFGGFFIVGNRHGFSLVTLAIITVGLVDAGMTTLLTPINLPPLVFAFNVVTILFLFPLKMLPQTVSPLRLIPIPLYLIKSPETNLKWYKRWSGQTTRQKTILTVPFMGEWSVLQGNNGEWTHKGVGKYAWDFVVRDVRGHQSKGFGAELLDYYAWELPVLSPAPGTIYSVENSVEDNPPQTANTERNWGNYVIINHGNGEFSELSHFKQGSIIVYPGQQVNRGDILGHCGNSGRSPVPHIHYQLQSSPGIGAPTIPATFTEVTINRDIHINEIPQKGDLVSAVTIDEISTWSLLGKETESWVFQTKIGWRKSTETLTFSTDEFGLPAIVSRSNHLWRIIDLPNFIIIRPDFKTFPSLLTSSVWIHIVGDRLVLPKYLADGFSWNSGRISRNESNWLIETEGRKIHLTDDGVIEKATIIEKPNIQFILKDRIVKKQ